ncbi:molybdopterin-dependent oxidoreductase [Inhella gelatinilytica]|uniref:Molybdopterin-dependent oxidoreductase n=1 Tax=Inhella gelatinilytica TaxID=2795030 RepID=A0A931NB06_9BURK|nr:molybdopterin-dependent oxidoreductase [Inhella gelatinilytica]MBH9553053.1 molybdopterin-dependent oxidoreductase [Inhella gelatinilytica]
MNKRDLLMGAATAAWLPAQPANAERGTPSRAKGGMSRGPAVLTVSGAIGTGNRGPLDTALDQLMVKQKLSFSRAHTFDYAALQTLPAVTIKPTLEYDQKVHELTGPLLIDVLNVAGARLTPSTSVLIRAIDGYAVQLSLAQLQERRFILALRLDGSPMPLGGLGPVWAVFDADRFPDLASKPLNERFALCPWATYSIEVKTGA